MDKSNRSLPVVETFASHHHYHLLCWKSVFAGLAIALMALLALTSLGAGIAGFTAESMINKEEGIGSSLVTGAGLWLGISVVISLFCGAYFSLRISRFITNRIGAAHGFVIASLFFGLLITGAGNFLGGVAKGVGNFTRTAAEGASAVGANPFVQDTITKALGNSNLKSDPKTVIEGLTARLLLDDTESVKSYFAYQTGLNQVEVDARVMQMQTEFAIQIKLAGEKTARAVGDAGVTLFIMFAVGLVGALFGGRIGAQANVERPFAKFEVSSYPSNLQPAHI